MKTEEILNMIDHTLSDYTSPDAMRWTPEAQPQKGLREGDTLTIDQVRGALQSSHRAARHVEILRQIEAQTWDGWLWNDDAVHRLGPGTIATVDPHTGQTVVTPFVSGSITYTSRDTGETVEWVPGTFVRGTVTPPQ